MERFSRLIQLIGNEKIELLAKKKVTIVGLGAVGGFALEILARCGTGHFTLVDFDVIVASNINRNIGALDSTVGKPKADVFAARIKDINPACTVEKKKVFAHKDSFDSIFAEKPDIVIDAIDSLGPKIELLRYCVTNKIAVISSMGAALKKDPAKIKIADISETDVCPLAKELRKHLKRKGITAGITVVYSTEHALRTGLRPPPAKIIKQADGKYVLDDLGSRLPAEEGAALYIRGRERNILGSYPAVTAMFGIYIAHAAIQALADI
ncbi:MAG: tRNA threonylcarbamoyladenosine dehydratase [Spirochaetes bacterium]|nr:tRNA threonylcarbamoyladenosine dehydratase [Spirochaetota bacterium]